MHTIDGKSTIRLVISFSLYIIDNLFREMISKETIGEIKELVTYL